MREGTTTRELMHYFKSSMAAQGGYGSHMTGGGGSRPWLSHPGESYVLKVGDVLYLDPAGHYKHYWCDMGRAAHIGPPSQKFLELYGVLQECHRAIVPQLRPGISSADLRQQARELTHDAMPAGLVALSHSIGIEQYDQPESIGGFLADDFVLEDGMVMNFETLYFELGWGVLQLEDTYHVTSAGAEGSRRCRRSRFSRADRLTALLARTVVPERLARFDEYVPVVVHESKELRDHHVRRLPRVRILISPVRADFLEASDEVGPQSVQVVGARQHLYPEHIPLVLKQRVEVDHRIRARAELMHERVRANRLPWALRRAKDDLGRAGRTYVDCHARVAGTIRKSAEERVLVEGEERFKILLSDIPVLEDDQLDPRRHGD